MKKITLVVMALSLGVASSAFAGKKFGAAGCGLGSMLFSENTTVGQVLAVTTNGTSGNQTFGITSGTSNCTEDGTVALQQQVPFFIEVNRASLARDISRGSGETLASFSSLLGCAGNTDQLGATLQKNYSLIFSAKNSTAGEVADSISTVIATDTSLASCQI